MIAASHLPDVHPACKAVLLKNVSKYSHLILVVPLVADEYLGRFYFCFCEIYVSKYHLLISELNSERRIIYI